jgi:hypothetical protein
MLTKKELDYYISKVESLESSKLFLKNLFDSNKSFNIIRVGDIEAEFLNLMFKTSPDEQKIIFNKLYFCGLNNYSIDDKIIKFNEIILNKKNNIFIQEPYFGKNDNYKFWGSFYEYLNNYDLINYKKWYSVHSIYDITNNGMLWNFLKNKKIAIVGAKSYFFKNYFSNNKHWLNTFNIDETIFKNVIYIQTPDLSNGFNKDFDKIKDDILLKIKDCDVALFSCGILAKFLASEFLDKYNKTGIDWGNSLEAIMNFSNKRPFLEKFSNYVHPDVDFIFDNYGQVKKIIKK